MKLYPHPKGGEFRKWYGNLEYVVNCNMMAKSSFSLLVILWFCYPNNKNTDFYASHASHGLIQHQRRSQQVY